MNSNITNENEIGRIESVKHNEWLLTPLFLFFAFTHQTLSIELFLLYIIGAQFPDILEGLFFKMNIEPEKRRVVSHTILFPILLLVISINTNIFLYYFSLAYFGHLIIDLFAGGDPVYIFGPFIRKFRGNIIHKEKRLLIGEFVYQNLGYLWEDSTNGDLAYFWILQFFGMIVGGVSLCIYLISTTS